MQRKKSDNRMHLEEFKENRLFVENNAPIQQSYNDYLDFDDYDDYSEPDGGYHTCPFPLGINTRAYNLPNPDLEAFKKIKEENLLAKQSQQLQSRVQSQQPQTSQQQTLFSNKPVTSLFPTSTNTNSLFSKPLKFDPQLNSQGGSGISNLFSNTSSTNGQTPNLFSKPSNLFASGSLFDDAPPTLPENVGQSFSLFSIATKPTVILNQNNMQKEENFSQSITQFSGNK